MTTERVGALLREANWLLARTGNRGLMDDVWWERRKAWEASFDEAALAGASPLSTPSDHADSITRPTDGQMGGSVSTVPAHSGRWCAECGRLDTHREDCTRARSLSRGAPTGTLREVAQRVVDSYEMQVRGAPLEAPYLGDAIRALRAVLEQP